MRKEWFCGILVLACVVSFVQGCEDDSGDESSNAYCGNGYCESGENTTSCPGDCGGDTAGNDGNDGTWTDPSSALTWEVDPTEWEYGKKSWSFAKQRCSALSLDGGGWHLPTIGELRTLIRDCPATQAGGSCNVEEGDCLASSCPDASCDGCSPNGGPSPYGYYWPDEVEGNSGSYWSSSPVEDEDGWAWIVRFQYGSVDLRDDGNPFYVRCVR